MKHYWKYIASLVIAGTAIVALAQVPASFIRSGMILGNPQATSSASGTAIFSATGGSISGLHVTGCITGVTYGSGVGVYIVAASGCPTNYVPLFSAGDTISGVTVQLDPVASYTATGFTLQALSNNINAYDPGLITILIP